MPQPKTQPRPPVVVACTSPATADLAAARGLPMLLGLHMTDEQKAAMIQRYAATAHAAGHDPAGVDHVSAMLAQTAETREQARSDVRTALPGWLADGLAGYRPVDGKPRQPRDPLAYTDFLCDVHALGDPADCARRIRDHTARTGIHHIILMVEALGDRTATLTNIDRLGAEVLNALIARHAADHLRLQPLGREAAHLMLAARIGARTGRESDAVDELVGLGRGLPLALAIIAAQVQASAQRSLTELAAELRVLGSDALTDDDPVISLPAVLSWSYATLSLEQRIAFGLLGLAPGPSISHPAAASLLGMPHDQAIRMLRALEDRSLLDRDSDGRWSMHDLIRDSARTVAKELDDTVVLAAMDRVVTFYVDTAQHAEQLLGPANKPIDLVKHSPWAREVELRDPSAATAWFNQEHRNLMEAQRTALQHGLRRQVWELAKVMKTFHDRQGYDQDDLTLWQMVITSLSNDPLSVEQVDVYLQAGRTCSRLGRHDEAAEHLRTALALGEAADEDEPQAHAHYEFALLHERLGDDSQARDHARRGLMHYRNLGNRAWEADALNQVGWYSARLDEYDIARSHCQAALALHREHGYTNGEANTLDSLGYTEHRAGEHQAAIDHYTQALDRYRQLDNVYETASTLMNLGETYSAIGDGTRARDAWGEALELTDRIGRDNDSAYLRQRLSALDHSGKQGTPRHG